MLFLKIEIEGVTPLLMAKFTDEAQQKATAGSGSSITSGNYGEPREQAERYLYLDDEGRPAIPQPNLYRCVIDGGSFFKSGRSKITTQKSSLIPTCFFIDGTMFPVDPPDWEVDTRPVRIPATGGRILRYRPCFNKWRLAFEATLDESVFDEKLMRQIIDAAGAKIGLGDFRPACKGPYGRFVVTRWESQKA